MTPVRVVGIDLGARRIGVAVSDASGTLASPHSVLERRGDLASDHAAIARLVRELEADRVVVGLPLSLSGEQGPAARAALAEVEALEEVLEMPVDVHDERLTTVSAQRSMADRGVKPAARRRVVDKLAAAVMLQSWLDARRAGRS